MRTLVTIAWLTFGLGACASSDSGLPRVHVTNDTVAAIQARLKAQGYRLWYPAQESAEPGDVWLEGADGRERLFGRPERLEPERTRGASFLLGFSTTSSSFSSNLGAVIGLLGGSVRDDREELSRLKAALQRFGVTKLHFRFDDANVLRFSLASLGEVDLPAGYREHVLGTDPPGVVSELVQSSGLIVRVTFWDAGDEAAAREALGNALGMELASKQVDERQFEWAVPPGRAFVFGVKYLTRVQVEKLLG